MSGFGGAYAPPNPDMNAVGYVSARARLRRWSASSCLQMSGNSSVGPCHFHSSTVPTGASRSTVALGELSPWRSVLLYLSRAVRGVYVAGRAKWSVAQRSVPCRATARCSVNSRTEPIRREQPIVLCDPITRGGHVPRWIGRDRCPVGSPRRKCDPHSERQYRDRRGSRWLAVSNGEPT